MPTPIHAKPDPPAEKFVHTYDDDREEDGISVRRVAGAPKEEDAQAKKEWSSFYLELMTFRQQYGHANPMEGHVADWLEHQRFLFYQGSALLTPLQIDLLRDLCDGFGEEEVRANNYLRQAPVRAAMEFSRPARPGAKDPPDHSEVQSEDEISVNTQHSHSEPGTDDIKVSWKAEPPSTACQGKPDPEAKASGDMKDLTPGTSEPGVEEVRSTEVPGKEDSKGKPSAGTQVAPPNNARQWNTGYESKPSASPREPPHCASETIVEDIRTARSPGKADSKSRPSGSTQVASANTACHEKADSDGSPSANPREPPHGTSDAGVEEFRGANVAVNEDSKANLSGGPQTNPSQAESALPKFPPLGEAPSILPNPVLVQKKVQHAAASSTPGPPKKRVLPAAATPDRIKKQSSTWEIRLEELKQFKAEHGHLFPRANAESQSECHLAAWVQRQRDHVTKRITLLPAMIQGLQELGVPGFGGYKEEEEEEARRARELAALKRNPPIKFLRCDRWGSKVRELKLFQRKFGHLDPQLDRPLEIERYLAEWLEDERELYRTGKSVPERLQILLDLGVKGFEEQRNETSNNKAEQRTHVTPLKMPFQPPPPCSPYQRNPDNSSDDQERWYETFQALEAFKRQNKKNPRWGWNKSEEERELGNWVAKQQVCFSRGELTTEQMELLRSVDARRFGGSPGGRPGGKKRSTAMMLNTG